MFNISTDKIGNTAVIECEGRLAQCDEAFRLRDVVTSRADAGTVLLDLSRVFAVEGIGLDMLVFLQRWAQDHAIRLKLFNPTRFVRDRLKRTSSLSEFDIVDLPETMALLTEAVHQVAA
jgi:anti-anti-sigma regulatory factor